MPTVIYRDRPIRYTLRYTQRKKTVGIRITDERRVVVNAPRGYERAAVERLLLKKGDWILRHLPPVQNESYAEGHHLLYLGERARVTFHQEKKRAYYDAGAIHINPGAGPVRKALETFYRNEAGRIIKPMVERWASVMGVAPEKVVIKSNRSSLGSCTPKKTLNFSYRIIMAPPEIVEYVVVHELAHLIHMNHSRSYWTTVCRYLADAKARKRWLREHARRLTL